MNSDDLSDIVQIRDLFNQLINDIPSDLKEQFDNKINIFNKNLNTIEAVSNGTIAHLPWIDLNNLLIELSSYLWKIWGAQSNEFKESHFVIFYTLDQIINFIGIDNAKTKLNQLNQYCDKLTPDHQNQLHTIENNTELLQIVLRDFFNYCSEVTVIDKHNLDDANVNKSEIVSTLTSQIWYHLREQIWIYDDENFLIDEFDDFKKN